MRCFYGETFEAADEFFRRLKEYTAYRNNEGTKLQLKGVSPVDTGLGPKGCDLIFVRALEGLDL